jgi:hypothetical protein
VLLIAAQERGAEFSARAANGTLLGLVALSAFVLAYARAAGRARWGLSLSVGWACAALIAVPVGWLAHGMGFPAALIAAIASLLLAYIGLPRTARNAMTPRAAAGDDLVLRMILTAVLVVSLASAAVLVGPLIGGMLAALPVLASVLAVFTHRRQGPQAVVRLMRGMIAGMAGFVGFCTVVAVLIVPLGTGPAFVAATVSAVGLQLLVLDRRPRQALSLLRP